jgi:succinoglycan biosynthesis transport protein ExoP
VVSSGAKPSNPAELLDSKAFTDFLTNVRCKFDFILLDCPPVLPVSDPSIIAPKADGTLVVVRIDAQARPQSMKTQELLRSVSANVVGLVVNRSPSIGNKYGYLEYYAAYQEDSPAVAAAAQ